jgi:hypothetical protein
MTNTAHLGLLHAWPQRRRVHTIYPQLYRIKEAQLDLFADRLSASSFRANQ